LGYNAITSRTDAGALIPEEVYRGMLGKATESSAVLSLFKHIPVTRAQDRMPVLSALPTAYFVQGDTGLKQTTEMSWANKYLNVEEIAAIFPIPDNVVADVELNIWDEAMPLLAEAIGRTLDNAVFFGVNAPTSWPTYIASAATTAGNSVTAGTAASSGGFYADIDKTIAKIEADGYSPTGFLANQDVRASLRAARDSQGRKLDDGRVNGAITTFDGMPIEYPMRGLWGTSSADPQLFVGAWDEYVVGVRQDITWKLLTEGVIQDNTGAIQYNLGQQDMSALRVVFRVGWQVANRINNQNNDASTRYPAAVLKRA
jgi:HK97 family phage major capsid protein